MLAVLVLAALPVAGLAAPAQAAAPAISSLTPVVGVPGATVRIAGTGFSARPADNVVTSGTVRATVTAATSTALTVSAPAPRVSSKVRVRTAGGTSGSRDFFMPPSPYAPARVASRVRATLGGAGVDVVNPVNDRISLVVFDARAGQRFAVDMRSTITGSQARLYSPGGTILRSVRDAAPGRVFLDTVTAAVNGTYSIAIDGRSSGAMVVQIRAVPADSTGTITRGAAQTVTTTAIGQNARRSFTGTAGQRVALEFSDLALTGNPFPSARLLLVRPDGTKLGTERLLQQLGGSTSGLVDTVTLPVTGTYGVKLDPLLDAVGSVRLLLHGVPPDSTGTMTIGTPVTVSTTVGQNASRSFSGTAGQRLVLDGTSVTYPQGARVTVLRPDGTRINERGFFPPAGFLEHLTLDVTGTHRIRIDPEQATTGSVTMVLRTVPPDSTGTVTLGAPQTVTTTAIGQNAVRTFTATAGQRFALDVDVVTYLLRVSVHEPTFLSEVTDSVGIGPRDEPYWSDVFVAPTTGTYRIRFDGIEREFGSVRMVLRSVPPDDTGTLVPGTASQVSTTVAGQNARRTFTGEAGTRIALEFTANTYGLANLQLPTPAGGELFRDEQLFTQADRWLEVDLPETGTYTVVVDPYQKQTGSVSVLLHVAPPPHW